MLSKRFAVPASLVLLSLACGDGGGNSPDSLPAEPTPRIAVPEANVEPTVEPGVTPAPTPQPAAPIRFIAIGDTGMGTTAQMDVAAAVGEKCEADGCDFGILLGDNFYDSGVSSATDPQFESKFQVPYGPLGFPFYVVLGNHDYGAGGGGSEYEKGAYQVEYAKTHANFILPSAHYDFEAGAAAFLVTDTNLALRGYDNSTAKQTDYFQAVLSTTDRPWKIALTHHPVYSNGKHGNVGSYDGAAPGSQTAGTKLKPLFDDALCGNVDLYFSGHDHNLQVLPGTQECPGTFVVSGAGAKVTSLSGSNPTLFQKNALGFAYVVVTGDTITIEMVGVDAETLFTTSISR